MSYVATMPVYWGYRGMGATVAQNVQAGGTVGAGVATAVLGNIAANGGTVLGLTGAALSSAVPVIGAVNGPATIHAELAVLSDIVLAADHAVFADLAHVLNGVVPGDGVHTVWPMLLGPNRGRYFLLTGEQISAAEAQRLGAVAEVLPLDQLMPRARELATRLAQNPTRMLRHTRSVLVRHLRKRMADELGFGLGAEALATLTV